MSSNGATGHTSASTGSWRGASRGAAVTSTALRMATALGGERGRGTGRGGRGGGTRGGAGAAGKARSSNLSWRAAPADEEVAYDGDDGSELEEPESAFPAFGGDPSAFGTPAFAGGGGGTFPLAASSTCAPAPPQPSNQISTLEVLGEDSESRKRRFESTLANNRYMELKPLREAQRASDIKRGLIPDPLKPMRLDEATNFLGTCEDMCPEFEREEREYQKAVDLLERYPGTNRIDPSRAVKAFHRPAAGNDQPLPSDVRPPHILKATLDYLFHTLLPTQSLHLTHPFLRDRTRAVRQDFTMQNERGAVVIECNERIARYHILALGTLREESGFSESQELEQLRKVLKSLNEFYDDARTSRPPLPTPNEPEFRAYNILTHLRDPDIIWATELLPRDVFDSPLLQTALSLHSLVQRSNIARGERASPNAFSRFFRLIAQPEVPYLFGCILSTHFAEIRKNALETMRGAYIAQHALFPARTLAKVLGCDGEDEVAEICTNLGLEVREEKGRTVVELHKAAAMKNGTIVPRVSQRLVEGKRGRTTYQEVIDGAGYVSQVVASIPTTPSVASSPRARRPSAPVTTGSQSAPWQAVYPLPFQPTKVIPPIGLGYPSLSGAATPYFPSATATPFAPTTASPFAPATTSPFAPPIAPKPQRAVATLTTPIATPVPTPPPPALNPTAPSWTPSFTISPTIPHPIISVPSVPSPLTKPAPPPLVLPSPRRKVSLPLPSPVPPSLRAPLLNHLISDLAYAVLQAFVVTPTLRAAEHALEAYWLQRRRTRAANVRALVKGLAEEVVREYVGLGAAEVGWGAVREGREREKWWRVWVGRTERSIEEEEREREETSVWERVVREIGVAREDELVLSGLSIGKDERGGEREDQEMAQKVEKARVARDQLWEPGTFLDIIVAHVDGAFGRQPAGLRRTWSMLLSTKDGTPFASWLACKFGLEDGRVEFDTPFADVEVAVVEDAVGEVAERTGMLVFDCTTNGAEASSPAFWTSARQRIRSLVDEVQSQSIYSLSLLVVLCPDHPLSVSAIAALSSKVTDELRLSDLSDLHASSVLVINLVEAEAQLDVQAERLLSSIAMRPERAMRSLEGFVEPLLRPWRVALQSVLMSAARSSTISPSLVLGIFIEGLNSVIREAQQCVVPPQVLAMLPPVAPNGSLSLGIASYISLPLFAASSHFPLVSTALAERPTPQQLTLVRLLLDHLADFVLSTLSPLRTRQESFDTGLIPALAHIEAELEDAERKAVVRERKGKRKASEGGAEMRWVDGTFGDENRADGVGSTGKKVCEDEVGRKRGVGALGLLMRDAKALLER